MRFQSPLLALLAALLVFGGNSSPAHGASATILYYTGFEADENYDIQFDLVGQKGWNGIGTAGDDFTTGLLDDFFLGFGQQAYLGGVPPLNDGDNITIWQPVNYDPIAEGRPIITFTVLMSVTDSTAGNGQYDEFRWSIYNDQNQRLFTLIFDNHSLGIDYLLDESSPPFRSTGKTFLPDTIYELQIGMDYSRNKWSARLDNVPLVVDAPITTRGQTLTFGDVDAVWSVRTPGSPGDNFLAFDDFLITAEPDFVPQPLIDFVSRLSNNSSLLRLHGESGIQYIIEGSTNLTTWLPLKTNTPIDGTFEYVDTSVGQAPKKFYRARVAD